MFTTGEPFIQTLCETRIKSGGSRFAPINTLAAHARVTQPHKGKLSVIIYSAFCACSVSSCAAHRQRQVEQQYFRHILSFTHDQITNKMADGAPVDLNAMRAAVTKQDGVVRELKQSGAPQVRRELRRRANQTSRVKCGLRRCLCAEVNAVKIWLKDWCTINTLINGNVVCATSVVATRRDALSNQCTHTLRITRFVATTSPGCLSRDSFRWLIAY